MPTTDLGLDVPAASDPFDPQGDMVELAASLEGHVIVPVANVTARNALAATLAPTASQPLVVDRADAPAGAELERTDNGTTWYTIPAGPRAPYAVATGLASVASIVAGGALNVAVTFPAGRFTVAPIVHANGVDEQGRLTVSVTSRTSTGCTLVMANRSAAPSPIASVAWTATQMTPTTAAG